MTVRSETAEREADGEGSRSVRMCVDGGDPAIPTPWIVVRSTVISRDYVDARRNLRFLPAGCSAGSAHWWLDYSRAWLARLAVGATIYYGSVYAMCADDSVGC